MLLSFIPTCLVIIFTKFHVVKASTEMQAKVQHFYHYFLVAYILLVTAVIANEFLSTLRHIASHPPDVFTLFANTLPKFTHFYLHYMLVQCSSHAMKHRFQECHS